METVLLAEDTESEAFFFREMLQPETASWTLRIVVDGAEAIDYLSGLGLYANRSLFPLPTLILLDIHPPKRSGLDVLEWIRNDPRLKNIPVIILSSSNQDLEISHAQELDANACSVSPPGLSQLVEILRIIHHYWLELRVLDPLPN